MTQILYEEKDKKIKVKIKIKTGSNISNGLYNGAMVPGLNSNPCSLNAFESNKPEYDLHTRPAVL